MPVHSRLLLSAFSLSNLCVPFQSRSSHLFIEISDFLRAFCVVCVLCVRWNECIGRSSFLMRFSLSSLSPRSCPGAFGGQRISAQACIRICSAASQVRRRSYQERAGLLSIRHTRPPRAPRQVKRFFIQLKFKSGTLSSSPALKSFLNDVLS